MQKKWITNACNIDESEKACYWVVEVRHKRINSVWFYLCVVLEEAIRFMCKSNFWQRKVDEWLASAQDGRNDCREAQRTFGGNGNIPYFYYGGCMNIYIYQNSSYLIFKMCTFLYMNYTLTLDLKNHANLRRRNCL